MADLKPTIRTAEQVASTAVRAGELPKPLDTLNPEEREFLLPYLEAREKGLASGRIWPSEVHAVMRRYVVACGEYGQALRAAGVVVPSLAETLRAKQAARRKANEQNAAEQSSQRPE